MNIQNTIIKNILEEKLGSLSDEEVNFAIEQFELNSLNIRKSRKLSTSEALDELSTNIDFYNRQISQIKQ